MTASAPTFDSRDPFKRAAAYAAVELVQDGMVVGLGTGTTAAFAIEALAARQRQGLRVSGIPSSAGSARLATQAGIPLTTFAQHKLIDITIDGADEVERITLNLIKGLGGALLHEKILAAASRRFVIIADGSKLVDRLGEHTPVPVEVVGFGLEPALTTLAALGASVAERMTETGHYYVTESHNRILDCNFGTIMDPARLEARIRGVVGVVESGLFISRADSVFVADDAGIRRLDSARIHGGGPPVLVLMGVSGAGKTTIGQEIAARLGWKFQDADALHPEINVAKMHAGIPLTDEDRWPWLAAVAAWIDEQRAHKEPGIIACSALKQAYRKIIIGERPEVRLVYLRGGRDLIASRLTGRHGHFMPPALLQSQFDTLEEPEPGEGPLTVDIGPAPGAVAQEILRSLGATVPIG